MGWYREEGGWRGYQKIRRGTLWLPQEHYSRKHHKQWIQDFSTPLFERLSVEAAHMPEVARRT